MKRDADEDSDESGPTRKYFRGERERIESFDGGSGREVRLLIASKVSKKSC